MYMYYIMYVHMYMYYYISYSHVVDVTTCIYTHMYGFTCEFCTLQCSASHRTARSDVSNGCMYMCVLCVLALLACVACVADRDTCTCSYM